jgi:hypothetical protein
MLKYFPDFDNLDLYSDVQLLDPRFEDDSDKNDEQPSLVLYGGQHSARYVEGVCRKRKKIHLPCASCRLTYHGSCGKSY